jgi:hypothetical protein
VLETAADADKTQTLFTKYQRAWYAAVAGWGFGLLMTLGLLALLAQPRLSAEPPADSNADDPPAHRIS